MEIEALFNHWKRQRNLQLIGGLSSSEIISFERRNGVFIPPDFSEYLKFANGFESSEKTSNLRISDDEGFEFYPLLEEGLLTRRYFIFCGWPDGFLEYALCVGVGGDNGRVVQVIDKRRGYALAESFSGFVGLYLADSKLLYSAGTEVVGLD